VEIPLELIGFLGFLDICVERPKAEVIGSNPIVT